MSPSNLRFLLFLMSFAGPFTSCDRSAPADEVWVTFIDPHSYGCGYQTLSGKVVIPAGKYEACFTDTFATYAVVVAPEGGLMAIDRREDRLYGVFQFDNGPDYPSEGLFRIVEGDRIGYADAATGAVVIPPRFVCAYPFENGVAKVSDQCTTSSDGEHESWESEEWYYVDKTGSRINQNQD